MNSLLKQALEAADETRALEIGRGVLEKTPDLFRAQFGNAPALIVADTMTFEVAGHSVSEHLREAGHASESPLVLDARGLHAEYSYFERIEEVLRTTKSIPIAVGSGTINDLVKLAAHRTERPYLAVATAASMDGYTAFGASITRSGSKQTFACPAPLAVLADLDIIAAAPPVMNASGYADLLAKITSGADWIVADELGEESIVSAGWSIQGRLREWLKDPLAVHQGDPQAIQNLMEGLLMGGFAMQATKSSRCASGAEHQFSHLWDMEHHVYQGAAPSHGFKVGIATLAMTRFYEALLAYPVEKLDVESIVSRWPLWEQQEVTIRSLYSLAEIQDKAVEESRAKYISADQLRQQLQTLQKVWPSLKNRLRDHLIPSVTLKEMLQTAGAPVDSTQIGISSARLRQTFIQAQPIRRRFTALDLALRAGILEALAASIA